jgi:hypothetical protein
MFCPYSGTPPQDQRQKNMSSETQLLFSQSMSNMAGTIREELLALPLQQYKHVVDLGGKDAL